jgi:hypothetical protein
MTLILHQANIQQLYKLLERPEHSEIDGLLMPTGEAIVPDFLIEFLIDRLNQEPQNSFWWLPWFVVVDSLVAGLQQQLVVGMIGFKKVSRFKFKANHQSKAQGYCCKEKAKNIQFLLLPMR